MYPQRSVLTCGLATALEPPNFNHALVRGAIGAIQYVAGYVTKFQSTNKFAALLAAICARIGSRKAKSKAGEIPPCFLLVRLSFGVWKYRHAQALDPVRFQEADVAELPQLMQLCPF